MDAIWQDLKYAARALTKNAGFAAVAVLSLGFGIGAATTFAAAIDAIAFRPLPYPDADRLVALGDFPRSGWRNCCVFSKIGTALEWDRQARSYDGRLALYANG